MYTLNMGLLATMIRNARGAKGLRDMAATTDISASTLSRIESGHVPDMETFLKLCDVLNTTPAYFFSYTGSPLQSDPPAHIARLIRADSSLEPSAANALAIIVEAGYRQLRNSDVSIE